MKTLPVNEQIRSNIVVLVNIEGENKGQFTRSAAIQMARNEGLDLIQVSQTVPPVCKIADFGKLQYERSKAEKRHHHAPEQKEMWFKLKTAQADYDRKVSQVRGWLEKNHKVVMGVKLKGREKYDDNQRRLAREMLTQLSALLAELSAAAKLSEGGKETSILLHPKNS
jgi:translation initiation factor IF-3